jgi:hypothetical protein
LDLGPISRATFGTIKDAIVIVVISYAAATQTGLKLVCIQRTLILSVGETIAVAICRRRVARVACVSDACQRADIVHLHVLETSIFREPRYNWRFSTCFKHDNGIQIGKVSSNNAVQHTRVSTYARAVLAEERRLLAQTLLECRRQAARSNNYKLAEIDVEVCRIAASEEATGAPTEPIFATRSREGCAAEADRDCARGCSC